MQDCCFKSAMLVVAPEHRWSCCRNSSAEYVLDYILERKRVDDLLGSIKSNRYETQKYGMRRCGLRHLMYLVEGDPDHLAPDSCKPA